MRARLALLLAGSVALGGCAYGYGGYGSPYSGLSVGVGYGSGYGGYGYGGYGSGYGSYYGYPGGYGYTDPYWGWYGDYYYPGTGYYVYDSYRRPHVWSDSQKRYWTQRRERVTSRDRRHDRSEARAELRQNWSGFEHRGRKDRDRDHDRDHDRR